MDQAAASQAGPALTRTASKYAQILRYALTEWRALSGILVITIAYSALVALQPWPLKLLVDHALGSQPLPDTLQRWLADAGIGSVAATLVAVAALVALAVFALEAALDAALTVTWARAGQRMVYTLAGDLFQQLQRLSLGYHARRTVGDSLTRVTTDAWCVQAVVDSLLVTPARQLMVLVAVGLLAWRLDPGLTLLMVIGTPLLAASALYFGRVLRQSERRTREAGSRLTAFVHQVLGAMPLVQVSGAAVRNRQLFATLAAESVSATRSAAQRVQAYALVNGSATTAGMALVVWFGGRQVMDRQAAPDSIGRLRSLHHRFHEIGGRDQPRTARRQDSGGKRKGRLRQVDAMIVANLRAA